MAALIARDRLGADADPAALAVETRRLSAALTDRLLAGPLVEGPVSDRDRLVLDSEWAAAKEALVAYDGMVAQLAEFDRHDTTMQRLVEVDRGIRAVLAQFEEGLEARDELPRVAEQLGKLAEDLAAAESAAEDHRNTLNEADLRLVRELGLNPKWPPALVAAQPRLAEQLETARTEQIVFGGPEYDTRVSELEHALAMVTTQAEYVTGLHLLRNLFDSRLADLAGQTRRRPALDVTLGQNLAVLRAEADELQTRQWRQPQWEFRTEPFVLGAEGLPPWRSRRAQVAARIAEWLQIDADSLTSEQVAAASASLMEELDQRGHSARDLREVTLLLTIDQFIAHIETMRAAENRAEWLRELESRLIDAREEVLAAERYFHRLRAQLIARSPADAEYLSFRPDTVDLQARLDTDVETVDGQWRHDLLRQLIATVEDHARMREQFDGLTAGAGRLEALAAERNDAVILRDTDTAAALDRRIDSELERVALGRLDEPIDRRIEPAPGPTDGIRETPPAQALPEVDPFAAIIEGNTDWPGLSELSGTQEVNLSGVPKICAVDALWFVALVLGVEIADLPSMFDSAIWANGMMPADIAKVLGAKWETDGFNDLDEMREVAASGKIVMGTVTHGDAGAHMFVMYRGEDGAVWVHERKGHEVVDKRFSEWDKPSGQLHGIVLGGRGERLNSLAEGESPGRPGADMPGGAVAGDPDPGEQGRNELSRERREAVLAAVRAAGLSNVVDLAADGNRVDVAATRAKARAAVEFWDHSTAEHQYESIRTVLQAEYPDVFAAAEVVPSRLQSQALRRAMWADLQELRERARHRVLDDVGLARLQELGDLDSAFREADTRGRELGLPVHLVSYGDGALVIEFGDRKAAAQHQIWFVPPNAAESADLTALVRDAAEIARVENQPERVTATVAVLRYGAVGAEAGTVTAVGEEMAYRIVSSRAMHETRTPWQPAPTVEVIARGDGVAVWDSVAERLPEAGIGLEPVLARAGQWTRALPGAPELTVRSTRPTTFVTVGDPRTADQVVVLVNGRPGALSLRAGLRDATGVYAEERRAHPERTVAVVVLQADDPALLAADLADLAAQRIAPEPIRLHTDRADRALLRRARADERVARNAFTRPTSLAAQRRPRRIAGWVAPERDRVRTGRESPTVVVTPQLDVYLDEMRRAVRDALPARAAKLDLVESAIFRADAQRGLGLLTTAQYESLLAELSVLRGQAATIHDHRKSMRETGDSELDALSRLTAEFDARLDRLPRMARELGVLDAGTAAPAEAGAETRLLAQLLESQHEDLRAWLANQAVTDADMRVRARRLDGDREHRRRLAEKLSAVTGIPVSQLTRARVAQLAAQFTTQHDAWERTEAVNICLYTDDGLEDREQIRAIAATTAGLRNLHAALRQEQARVEVTDEYLGRLRDDYQQRYSGNRFQVSSGRLEVADLTAVYREAKRYRPISGEGETIGRIRQELGQLIRHAEQRDKAAAQLRRLGALTERLTVLAGERVRVQDQLDLLNAALGDSPVSVEMGWQRAQFGRTEQLRTAHRQAGAALADAIGASALAELGISPETLTTAQLDALPDTRRGPGEQAALDAHLASFRHLDEALAASVAADTATEQLVRIDAALDEGFGAQLARLLADEQPRDAFGYEPPDTAAQEHLRDADRYTCLPDATDAANRLVGKPPLTAQQRERLLSGLPGTDARVAPEIVGSDWEENGFDSYRALHDRVASTGDVVVAVLGRRGFDSPDEVGSHAVTVYRDGKTVRVIDNGEDLEFWQWQSRQSGVDSLSGMALKGEGSAARPLVNGKSRAIAGLDFKNVRIGASAHELPGYVPPRPGLPVIDSRYTDFHLYAAGGLGGICCAG